MDKFRTLTTYSRSLLRNFQGSAELFEINHIFYEAKRIIEKEGWKEEALEIAQQEYENVKKNYSHIEKEYMNYINSGEESEVKEEYFNRCFHKLGINGRAEIRIKYKAVYGEYPSDDKLKELLNERRKENEEQALIFIENQVKISNGEKFDPDALRISAKFLKDRGLYDIVLRNLPSAISCYDADCKIGDFKKYFKLYLY